MTKEQILSSAMSESAELRGLWAEWLHMLMAEEEESDTAA
jgi:hypothetical protein